jgi:hypothetical protein
VRKQALERLSRQVTDGLAGVFPTEHEKADVGVGKRVLHEAFDPQVFRV